MSKPRCESIGPQHAQCGLPKGHTGQHGNGMQVRSWSTEQELKQETVGAPKLIPPKPI